MKHHHAWRTICQKQDLVAWSGVAARVNDEHIALFYLPGESEKVYAISNIDPFSGASVLARGILGTVNDMVVVASPIYKQHFNLENGHCLEDERVNVRIWPVKLRGQHVEIAVDAQTKVA